LTSGAAISAGSPRLALVPIGIYLAFLLMFAIGDLTDTHRVGEFLAQLGLILLPVAILVLFILRL
jgi:hypothetical protein